MLSVVCNRTALLWANFHCVDAFCQLPAGSVSSIATYTDLWAGSSQL